MHFSIGEPALPDAAKIADLHVSTWREAYSHILPGDFFTVEYIQHRHGLWKRILGESRDAWSIRVAESEGEIIGFACSGPSMVQEGQSNPRDHQLYMIYVAAARHGTGAGQALLDATLGDRPASLWVAKENPRAQAFYRRNGFELDGVVQADPAVPTLIEVRMVR